MADVPPQAREPGPIGCFFGLGVGVLTVAIFYGSLSAAGRNLSPEWGVLLLHVLMVAAPFVLLAGVGVTAKVPWFVGLTLTAMFWGYLFFDVMVIHRGDGANIGLGLLMFVSPLIIAGATLAAATATHSLPDP
jgi:hypothetical protein